MVKKIDDNRLVGLNSVGISLASIAKRMNCHHTTIAARLDNLNIQAADTRRSFMEDIFDSLSEKQQEWLINQLGPTRSVKDFVKSLIIKEYMSNGQR